MKIEGIENDKIYKAVVCNRCGETLLCKYVGTKTLDGGYTRQDKFEELPNGWNWHLITGTLCPECENLFQNQLKIFMENQ